MSEILNTFKPARAGIVLAGGRGRRMGWPKAELPFGPETLLQRVVRLLSTLVEPIVVVGAPGQHWPELPGHVLRVADRTANQGPLEGLRTGLAALPQEYQWAYVGTCDSPWIVPKVVELLFEQSNEYDAVVPCIAGQDYPLTAVYRTSVTDRINHLLAANERRAIGLLDGVRTLRIGTHEMRAVDPTLKSLFNVNHANQYLDALAEAGFQPDEQIMVRLRQSDNIS